MINTHLTQRIEQREAQPTEVDAELQALKATNG